MFSKRDHFSDASQTSIDKQIDLNTVLGHRLIESAQRLFDLQINTAKTLLHEVDVLFQQMLAVPPRAVGAVAVSYAQRTSTRSYAYGCYVAGITVGTQSELVELLGTQFSETNIDMTEMITDVSRSAQGGANRLTNLMRALFDQANASFERLTHAAKQVLDSVETSWIAIGHMFTRAAESSMPVIESRI